MWEATTALSTSAAAVLALLAFWGELRRRKDRDERDQAERVCCWVDKLSDGRTVARVLNASEKPIFSVELDWIGLYTDDSSEPLDALFSVVIPPGKKVTHRGFDFPHGWHDGNKQSLCVNFSDAGGRRWTYNGIEGIPDRPTSFLGHLRRFLGRDRSRVVERFRPNAH